MNGAPVPASTAAIANPLGRVEDPAGSALRNLIWLGGEMVVSVVLGLVGYGLFARDDGGGGAGELRFGVAGVRAGLGVGVCGLTRKK